MFCLECLRCRVHVVSFNSFSLFSMRRSFRSQIHSFKGFFPSIPKSIYAHCTRFNHNSEFLNSMFSQIFWVLATHTHTHKDTLIEWWTNNYYKDMQYSFSQLIFPTKLQLMNVQFSRRGKKCSDFCCCSFFICVAV